MGLLKLPPELLLRISAHLTTPELGMFRRSCKSIEAPLFDTFAKEFFTKRQFMLENISLQVLVDIANHPSLSRWLTEVIIGLDALVLYRGSPIDASLARYEAGYIERNIFLETGQARDMLVDAFSKLPNLRTVGLRDYSGGAADSGRERDGPEARWRSYGWSSGLDVTADPTALSLARYQSTVWTDPGASFPLIICALGKANVKAESIEVFLRRRQAKLAPSSFNVLNGHMLPATTIFLASLKKLMLTLGATEYQHSNDGPEGASLKRFLHHTVNLEYLRLNFEPWQRFAGHFVDWLSQPASNSATTSHVPDTPTSPVVLPHLTGLDLGMLSVEVSALVNVLTKFDLKSFNLWKVVIYCKDKAELDQDPDRWSCFFSNLANALPASTRLGSVMVGYVSQSLRQDDGLSQPLRISFASDHVASKGETKDLLDKIEYRASYGSSVKLWALDTATRTSVERPALSETLSEDEGESDSEGGFDVEIEEVTDDSDSEEDDA